MRRDDPMLSYNYQCHLSLHKESNSSKNATTAKEGHDPETERRQVILDSKKAELESHGLLDRRRKKPLKLSWLRFRRHSNNTLVGAKDF